MPNITHIRGTHRDNVATFQFVFLNEITWATKKRKSKIEVIKKKFRNH